MSQAIALRGVSKRFRVPLDHAASLQYRFAHPLATRRYREFQALQDVSFTVPAGQFLGITGPNGCGKSTLLKVISQIYEPDDGSVSIRGRVSPFLELGVGFKPDLTARQNVYLGGAVLGLTRPELTERMDDVFAFAELAGFADQKLKNFSSGMTLRLAFSVAMLADADILLMDEVLAVGDAHFQEKCFDVFSYYKRDKRTIILVSHDLAALETYCDRVILLESGRVLADGAASNTIAEYRHFVANLAETRSPHSAIAAPATDLHRWGTKEVEISHVELLGADGQPHQSFHTGEALTVSVSYRVNLPVSRFVCAVRFQRGDGQYLAEPNSHEAQLELGPVTVGDTGTIQYRIGALPLLGASYIATTSLYSEHMNHTYDHLDDGLVFHVSDDLGRAGIVDLGGEWELEGAVLSALQDVGRPRQLRIADRDEGVSR
jgi:lipopolysaccharide transport system ATP-binding protein